MTRTHYTLLIAPSRAVRAGFSLRMTNWAAKADQKLSVLAVSGAG